MNLDSSTGSPFAWARASTALVIGGALGEPTTTNDAGQLQYEALSRLARATVSGSVAFAEQPAVTAAPSEPLDPRAAIAELRRRSGLTWAQLAELFGVSRRAVHFWASGKALKHAHEDHLRAVLEIVRTGATPSARATRLKLVESGSGESIFALLRDKRFADAATKLGEAPQRVRPRGTPLSAKAQADRAPLRPEELVDAVDEPAHVKPTRVRAGRSVRVKSGGTTG